MKKRLLLLMMMAGGAMMLPAQEPGGMLPAQEPGGMLPAQKPGGMLPAQEQVEMASIDADSAVIEQTDAATAEQTDTVLPDPDPEWYVAPLNYDSVMVRHNAPRRAAANNCPIDSVLTFDVEGNLVGVIVYEYDAAGNTIRTTEWIVQGAVRIGKEMKEWGFDETGRQIMKATYSWDNTTNNWKGTSKEEHTYVGNNETVRILYNTWLNNAWVADTKYTWAYEGVRDTAYVVYVRNTSTNELVLSAKRIRAYTSSGKTILEIQYTAHNGTTWSAGTKKVWDFDGSNNQILYDYFASYLGNDTWGGNGSTHEEWEYLTSQKKLRYEKTTISGGVWTNSQKEVWEYNSNQQQTLYKKWNGSGDNWVISVEENSFYDANKLNTGIENYAYSTAGVLLPTNNNTKKEEYTFNSAKKKIATVKYKWDTASSGWVKNSKVVSDVDAAGNSIETANYNWSATDNQWIGAGQRVLQKWNSSKKNVEKITQSWSNGAWQNVKRDSTAYEGGTKTIFQASFVWQNDVWVGTSRQDWHYNSAGLEDTIKTFRPIGTEWVDSLRTVKTYNGSTVILTKDEKWITAESRWVMQTMKRWDISDVTADGVRQTVTAIWRCGSDSIWTGISNDTVRYSVPQGRVIYESHYPSWSTTNNDWIPSYRIEITYGAQENNVTYTRRDDWTGSKWQGHYMYLYEYDEIGQEIASEIYNGWSTETNNWIGSTKTQTTFNAIGYPIEIWNYSWANNGWALTSRTLLSYDGANNVVEQIEQSKLGDGWVNSLLYEKEFHGSQMVKSNNYEWVNGAWRLTSQMEKIYDNDAQAKLRRDIYGVWYEGQVIAFTDKNYYYACDPNSYTIRFENYDGTLLESHTVQENQTPVYEGAEPTKPATAQYTYSFKGWAPALVPAVAHATYTAEYDSIVNRYRITWLNADDVEVAVDSLEYGAMPSHEDVVKPSTSEWAYLFAGWSPAIVAVTGDATYKAQLDSIQNGYRITWLDADDTELAVDSLAYGATPSHEYVVKANTAEWTYSFVGWTPEIAAVTGDATYKAQIDSVRNRYRITWLDADDTEIAVDSLAYGATPSHEYVLKANTAEWTYSFVGWTPEIAAVTGDATYKAQIDSVRNSYFITFKNGEETLQSTQVAYGSMPVYEGEEPTKQGDAQYTYSFNGWDAEIAAVTGEATYNATFISTVNTCTITWLMDDGTKIDEQEMAYGATPTHADAHKDNTAQYTITFVGWDKDFAAVTGDATYTAVFDSVVNTYTITFYFDNGVTILDQQVFEYGQMPSTNFVPSRELDAQYSYTFTGWSPELVPVTGDASYVATFEAMLNQYTIIFRNYDGKELQNTKVDYGTMPEYTGETPTRKGNMQYSYDFIGWSPELDTVRGAATYTAVYEQVLTTYTIIFYDEDGVTVLDSVEVEYGKKPSTTVIPTKEDDEQYTYTFAGWSPTIVAATRNTSYTATYTATLKSEGLWDVETDEKAQKVMIDGVMYIIRGGKKYGMDGAIVE